MVCPRSASSRPPGCWPAWRAPCAGRRAAQLLGAEPGPRLSRVRAPGPVGCGSGRPGAAGGNDRRHRRASRRPGHGAAWRLHAHLTGAHLRLRAGGVHAGRHRADGAGRRAACSSSSWRPACWAPPRSCSSGRPPQLEYAAWASPGGHAAAGPGPGGRGGPAVVRWSLRPARQRPGTAAGDRSPPSRPADRRRRSCAARCRAPGSGWSPPGCWCSRSRRACPASRRQHRGGARLTAAGAEHGRGGVDAHLVPAADAAAAAGHARRCGPSPSGPGWRCSPRCCST